MLLVMTFGLPGCENWKLSIISHSFIAYTIGVHLNDHVIITNYAHWADTLQAVQLTSCARTRALKAVKKGTKASRASITTVGGRDTPFSARVDTEQIVVCQILLFPTSVTTVSTRFFSHHLAPHKYLQNIMKGAIESDNLVSDTNINEDRIHLFHIFLLIPPLFAISLYI